MTLGLEAIKFLLEQDEANVPIVQAWIDKWFWRGYRVTALVAQMLDYMLPRKVMSWKEAFELYFEEQMLEGLFQDLAFYGIKPPQARRRRDRGEGGPLPPGVLDPLPVLARRRLHHDRARRRRARRGSPRIPRHLRQALPPLWEKEQKNLRGRRPALRPRPAAAVPGLPDPDALHRAGRPDDDLPARSRTTRARRSRPAPTAASGSSSASRRSTCRPGCPCTRSTRATAAGRPSPTCWPGTACEEGDGGEYKGSVDDQQLEHLARRRRPLPHRIGGLSTMAVKSIGTYDFPSRSAPGALRRRPARAPVVPGEPVVLRRGLLPGPQGDDLG